MNNPMGDPSPGEVDFGEIDFPEGDWDAPAPESTGGISQYFSMDYYRKKAEEFQRTLFALDEAARSASDLASDPNCPEDLRSDLLDMLAELDGKKTSFRLAAEGVNLAASTINAVGGSLNPVSIPPGLGFALPALPVAAVAAFAAIAGLTAFAIQWLRGYNERLKTAQLFEAAGESAPRIAQSIVESENAVKLAESQGIFGGLGDVANIVKIGALALAGYLAWDMWKKYKG